MGRVLKQQDIQNQISKVRKGKKIVFTNGCFDLLHVGHIRYLQSAKELGDFLFVGVNADASVKRLKGEDRPIQNQEDRAEILAALDAVDFVAMFEQDTPLELIKTVEPDILVKGGDWSVDKIVGSKEVLARGGQVKSLQFVEGRSTSSLVQKIKKL